jgi:APA family basic amino acid/polyamine antiporter
MPSQLFRKKSLSVLLEEVKGENRLRRVLGPVALTSLGVGAIKGTGIFVSTGVVARQTAGPSLMLSYAVAGLVCVFAALCYSEFASMVPVAGSAYTYAYTTLGELFAWIIGWDLVLEYAVGAATVANGWSSYFQAVLGSLGIHLPASLSGPAVNYDPDVGRLVATGSIINLPAVIIVFVVTIVLIVGIKESANFNAAMVGVKVAAVLFVIGVGVFFINTSNWTPFAPFGYTGLNFFGAHVAGMQDAGGRPLGMMAGAALAFFSYIGFDSISTHSEEAKNPQRDIPIGIITSLVLCTLLYVAVIAVMTGMVPYDQLDINSPVSTAFKQVGVSWAQFLIALGGLTGITSVLLVMMLSQPRVLLAMARDGLLPASFFGAVHERFRTPWKSTILTGCFVAVPAAFLPINVLLNLVNMGTLMAFAIVCAAVLIMRRTNPDAKRPFRVPFVPVTPILGILTCLLLMFSLPAENWWRLLIWLSVGMLIYFGYSRRHSHLRLNIAEKAISRNISPADRSAARIRGEAE